MGQKNTKIQIHKYSIWRSARKTQHVKHFWRWCTASDALKDHLADLSSAFCSSFHSFVLLAIQQWKVIVLFSWMTTFSRDISAFIKDFVSSNRVRWWWFPCKPKCHVQCADRRGNLSGCWTSFFLAMQCSLSEAFPRLLHYKYTRPSVPPAGVWHTRARFSWNSKFWAKASTLD